MITCRSPQEIAKIRVSAQLAAATLQHITPMIQPGVTTFELDRAAEAYIRKHIGLPAFKGYRGFPATLCTSINAEVVHGIPSKKRRLVEGDIIGIDCGAIVDGYYGRVGLVGNFRNFFAVVNVQEIFLWLYCSGSYIDSRKLVL